MMILRLTNVVAIYPKKTDICDVYKIGMILDTHSNKFNQP